MNKIFAVGFNKTGTTSLHALFESMGFTSYHGKKWRACDDIELLRSYDCFSDGIPKDLAYLDRMFPNSKFILQVRELDTWIFSRLAHIERRKERNIHQEGPLWDNTETSVKYWIRQRNDHHLHVLSYFAERPSDLLVVNFVRDESAATRISGFLGHPGRRERPIEHVNPQKEHPLRHTEMLNQCIAEIGIAESELNYDILCPSLISNEMRDIFPADTSLLERSSEESDSQ
ncbi:MAG: hypothetical protein JRF69_08885 [Deltaproteobacteria bacterium]|nr:hypothetical protein [Deltaproteobacteria bacterium]